MDLLFDSLVDGAVVAAADAPIERLFADYLPAMAEEIGVNAEHPRCRTLVATNLRALSKLKGTAGGKDSKWFGSHGTSSQVMNTRRRRQFLVDASLIIASANPYSLRPDSSKTLTQLFDELKQGVLVASCIYLDDGVFEAHGLAYTPWLVGCGLAHVRRDGVYTYPSRQRGCVLISSPLTESHMEIE
jgi:hypothetical protein